MTKRITLKQALIALHNEKMAQQVKRDYASLTIDQLNELIDSMSRKQRVKRVGKDDIHDGMH